MTTFQEPPLQSRRAARQTERADAPPGGFTDPNAVTPPPASSSAPTASPQVESLPEPLNYATTSRPPLPQYDGQNLRPRRTAETTGHADLPPTQALPSQDVPSYRPTDYSPEGRRAAITPNWPGTSDGTVEFQTQNRDQALAAASSPPVSAPTTTAPAGAAPVVTEGEHTMTRRELRALREAEGITSVPTDQTPVVNGNAATPAPVAAAPVPVVPPLVVPPLVEPGPVASVAAPVDVVPPPLVAPAPQSSTRLDSALAEFDALASGREPAVLSADAPAPVPGRRAAQAETAVDPQPEPPIEQPSASEAPSQGVQEAHESPSALSAFEALFAAPSTVQPSAAAESAPSAAAPLLAPAVVAPAPAPEPTIDPLLAAPAPQGAPALVPPPAPSPVSPASGPTSVGHWSTQSALDDAEQVNETTISRDVGAGSGAITTSALVLPSVPEHTIGGPMSGSGEILLTGSISLPHSFSSTGAHPSQLDESDLDHLLDPGDHQVSNTDSMPVRATKAVSTHTATGSIIAPVKQTSTRGFTILIVAASVMAVVVVGLLVAGLVSGTL